jgi:hypothetical protein
MQVVPLCPSWDKPGQFEALNEPVTWSPLSNVVPRVG